jgi:lipopolysaccharide transport system permease protein
MALFFGFLLIIGAFPGWIVLCALPVIILQMAFSIGAGIFLATINVFYRDIHQTVQVILQFWFWLTPIVYFPVSLPRVVQYGLGWNPMYFFIRSYQGIFLEKTPPDWSGGIYPLLITIACLFAGVLSFHKLQHEIIDEL